MHLFGEERPEASLFYSDTEIYDIVQDGCFVVLKCSDYTGTPLLLKFAGVSILRDRREDESSRVEEGQLLKLKNGKRRVLLFDEDGNLILEIEFSACECIT